MSETHSTPSPGKGGHMAMRLATFVHISDLHFGDGHIDPSTGRIIQVPEASRLWATCSPFDGLLGHDSMTLARLQKFFDQIRQDENAH